MESNLERREFLKKAGLGLTFLFTESVSWEVFETLEQKYILDQKSVFYWIDHSDWINIEMLKNIKNEINVDGKYKYTYFLVEWQTKGQVSGIDKDTYIIWFEDKKLLNQEWELIKKLDWDISNSDYKKILKEIRKISKQRSEIAIDFSDIIKNNLAENKKSWIVIIVMWALHWSDFNWIELNWKIEDIDNLN
jgi:hypothetical protein